MAKCFSRWVESSLRLQSPERSLRPSQMVRPTKPAGERRRKALRVRLLAAEDAEIRRAARRAGLSLSDWIRDHLLKAARDDEKDS